MNTKTKQQKCVSGNFKRMNYFHGMLLTEQDFRDEQAYIREKLKLHNRLHGSGVVWGLCLVDKCIEITPQNEKITKIFIEPGLALDCSGNEIVVCHDFLVPIGDKVKKLKDCNQLSDPPPKLYIGIKYCECQSEPAEQLTAECDDDQLRPQFSRVREGFDVVILTEEEYYNCTNGLGEQNGKTHGCDCAGIPPCSEEE
ncbi:hypothetical protein GWN26_07485, partial [Candidatus Saccharibacteria bacterium]|nr:hypothetical protein [Calditrichia bacterium]NIV72094.1 hypothetical protein [Calditrichia bacterium]NIV98990.1 hypothetical protein [Candidatus Saccharibacteria bacterium]NIW79245.1 hypothetical protein [Calditrichia bacterium]